MIEAIVEELEPKQALFAELNGICGPEAILATNTSALSVSAVAAASGRPDRVVGLHFFNPAPLMKLIEVVRTQIVDEAAFADALAFASGLGKEAVPCADTPGFLVNRLLIPILNDAIRAMEETGASPEDIDRAMRFGAGWPMGPFALADLVGLDVHAHASEALWRGLREERMAPPARLQRMVEAGLHRPEGEAGLLRLPLKRVSFTEALQVDHRPRMPPADTRESDLAPPTPARDHRAARRWPCRPRPARRP